MSEKAIKADVDRFLELDAIIKKAKEEQDLMKESFKNMAREQERREFEGNSGGKVMIQPLTTSTGDPVALQKQCAVMGHPEKFYELVSVRTGDAKKYLGETMSEGIIHSTYEPYGKVVPKQSKE